VSTPRLNFLLALALFVFILPLLALIAIAVFCQDDGPVVFAHKRVAATAGRSTA
jgi:lipopolysaccharide/colanic/teichoic acid biosynthesis glycosyltransferase